MSRTPDFIVIGAMKCATSSLHAQLARHPGVFMSTPKEPNFFSDDEVFDRGMAWYSSLFADAPADALCGESSTHYTKLPAHPRTIERLAEVVPAPKLIYVMRHPVDRLVSHYIHAWTKREVSVPIDKAINQMPSLVDYGRYAMQLTPWVERFGREAILPVFLARLRAHPNDEMARIGAFLGLRQAPDWDHEMKEQNVSSARLRESPWRDRVLSLPGMTALRRALVPRSIRDRVKKTWTMQERPALSEPARREVVRRFDDDLSRLGSWLGTPLCCETFDDVTRRELAWSRDRATAA